MLGGGDAATATTPGFPLTLEAALAGGTISTADESGDVVDPTSADGDATEGDGADGGATTLDAALAAALALAGVPTAPTTDPAPTDTTTIGDGSVATEVDAAQAALAVDAAQSAAGTTSAGTNTAATAVAATTAAADAHGAQQPGDAAALATAQANADGRAQADGAADVARASAQAESAAATTDAANGTTSTAAAVETPTARRDASAHGGTQPVEHHAASAEGVKAFSAGGSRQHGLDLGSSDRHPTSTATVASAAGAAADTAASPSNFATAATAAAPGVDAPVVHASDARSADGSAALPPVTTTTAASHAGATTRAEGAGHHPGVIEPRWGERVADAVRLSALRGGGEIRLQLEPEGLGHIDVRLHLQSDGVRAVIVAEHESTRALLTSQQHVLQDAFSRSDLRLSGFSVDVGSGGNANLGRDAGAEQGQSAPSTPPAPVAAAVVGDASSIPTNTVGNGRLSVRV